MVIQLTIMNLQFNEFQHLSEIENFNLYQDEEEKVRIDLINILLTSINS